MASNLALERATTKLEQSEKRNEDLQAQLRTVMEERHTLDANLAASFCRGRIVGKCDKYSTMHAAKHIEIQ